MKLLVTGGAGFIGSNFIHYWLKKYPQDFIYNLDLLTYAGHSESLVDIADNPNYEFIQGDICNIELVDSLVSKVDTVVHFAAESHVDRSILDPQVFVKTNVLGTQTLLDAARKHHLKHFHHISTDEVFGALRLGSGQFEESTPYDPRSPYSASKAASDHLVRAYFHTFGLPITITNCSNNFGPFQDPEKLISRAITNLILGDNVKVYGDGKYVRDWLYVEDHCSAVDLVINKGNPGDTYLVGGQTEDVSNLEVIHKILNIMGLDSSRIEFVPDRPGHDRRYAVNWSKIKDNLGWKPQKSFDSCLETTVRWYQEHQDWWRPLKEASEVIYRPKVV